MMRPSDGSADGGSRGRIPGGRSALSKKNEFYPCFFVSTNSENSCPSAAAAARPQTRGAQVTFPKKGVRPCLREAK
jgi:hypothetical protein